MPPLLEAKPGPIWRYLFAAWVVAARMGPVWHIRTVSGFAAPSARAPAAGMVERDGVHHRLSRYSMPLPFAVRRPLHFRTGPTF